MPENKSLPLIETAVSEDTTLSPAVAAIVKKAHSETTEIIRLFEANQVSPVRHYLRVANGMIRGILGEPTNPEELSKLIALKKEFRNQEAANDEVFAKAA